MGVHWKGRGGIVHHRSPVVKTNNRTTETLGRVCKEEFSKRMILSFCISGCLETGMQGRQPGLCFSYEARMFYKGLKRDC